MSQMVGELYLCLWCTRFPDSENAISKDFSGAVLTKGPGGDQVDVDPSLLPITVLPEASLAHQPNYPALTVLVSRQAKKAY